MNTDTRISQVHSFAVCCFCRLPLIKVKSNWWCQTQQCRDIQRKYGIAIEVDGFEEWFHLPLPKQAKVEMQRAPNCMFAGSAGPGKSKWGRGRLVRRAIAYTGYRGLIVRKHLTELTATHISHLEQELKVLEARAGLRYKLKPKFCEFTSLSSVIHFGHLSDKRALASLLSTDYDDILADECSTINPDFLPELASRARTTNPAVIADGGAKFLPVTNPGGEASNYLRDMFIRHTPDFKKYPQLVTDYKPDDWVYIEATLDDNPYLEPDYAQKRLANLTGVRYKQLRHADWDTFEGQFFTQWSAQQQGQPWHVADIVLANPRR